MIQPDYVHALLLMIGLSTGLHVQGIGASI